MKYITVFLLLVFTSLINYQCTSIRHTADPTVYSDSSAMKNPGTDLKVSLKTGSEINHPTYAIWMEDMNGHYIKTLFVTKSYASGIFGHEMVGDTVWMPKPGASFQPAALPYWTHKKGPINGKDLVPTAKNPFVDGYTGATPKGDMTFSTRIGINTPFRILLEVNQAWDWNKYWTNNKYPDNPAYKHSAQPSLVYAVSVLNDTDVYYLNPVGHGDPKGESGKLYTNISSVTTAKNIFESISISLKK